MDKERISILTHNMMSEFRRNVGQELYPVWTELDDSVKELYYGVIDKVVAGIILTPEQIHEYWVEWAKTYRTDHTSIIPYEELSAIEKIKDELVLSMILIFADYLQ